MLTVCTRKAGGGGGEKRERICVDDASLLEDFQWSLQGNQELHSHWF